MSVSLWVEFLAFFHRDNFIENTRKLGYNARLLKNLILSHYGEKYARIRDIILGICFWLECYLTFSGCSVSKTKCYVRFLVYVHFRTR